MESVLFLNFYIFILALVFAILEIQIEGPHGWAANLPTWRSKKELMGKNLTGYHLSILILAFLIFHIPYAFGVAFNIVQELQTLSLLFMFIVLWDFLWFVLNPHYPLRNFKKGFISWHKKWFLVAPADYYYGLGLSLIILLPLVAMFRSYEPILWWSQHITLFSIHTLLLILFTLFVLKIDNWASTNS